MFNGIIQLAEGHSPRGECGLKCRDVLVEVLERMSLPARGVWVEIFTTDETGLVGIRHSPRGECGLKFSIATGINNFFSVTPREGSVG